MGFKGELEEKFSRFARKSPTTPVGLNPVHDGENLVPVVMVLTAPVAHRRASDGIAMLVVATAWMKEEGGQ
jgi:hypothetical protein